LTPKAAAVILNVLMNAWLSSCVSTQCFLIRRPSNVLITQRSNVARAKNAPIRASTLPMRIRLCVKWFRAALASLRAFIWTRIARIVSISIRAEMTAFSIIQSVPTICGLISLKADACRVILLPVAQGQLSKTPAITTLFISYLFPFV